MSKVVLVAFALAGAVALFLLLQGDGATSDPDALTNGASPRLAAAATASKEPVPPHAVDREHPGYAVYSRRGCNVCHGPALKGTNMAPSLEDADEHWEPASFARYLSNPDSSVRANPRLREVDARYSMFVMPAYQLVAEELLPLTELILGKQE